MIQTSQAKNTLSEVEFADRIRHLGGQVYIVGGWVRDQLIHRPSSDKDYVICNLDVRTFQRHFAAQSVGHKFPVFLLNIDGTCSEVAFARTETKNGSGYRGFDVDFSPQTTIEQDLFRRDSTMNSMAISLSDGSLIDPFHGQDDTKNKVIRATSEHFRDDPVRALRAARQSAQLNFQIESGTLQLMAQCAAELAHEPRPRILAETTKALLSEHPAMFFQALREAQLLECTFPELAQLIGVPQPAEFHHGLDAFEHSMQALTTVATLSHNAKTRFAALVHDLGKGLTPRELWPHHYDHARRGLEALASMNARMTLPKTWLKSAEFFIAQHMRIPVLRKASSVLDVIEIVRRSHLLPCEIEALLIADGSDIPVWLKHFQRCLEFLDSERSALRFPAALPAHERSAWLRMRLADKLKQFLTELPHMP